MEKFSRHTGVIAPLDRVNVDTDAIIPKQFLKKIERTGFGKHLFHEWRFTDYEGRRENPEFVLNNDPYRKASVLLTRDNFGSGSSREHAPWALTDFGIRVIVAPSFADIFYNNSVKNGLLLIPLNAKDVDKLFEHVLKNPGAQGTADLEKQTFSAGDGLTFSFAINSFAKHCLLNGLDQIGWTLEHNDDIARFEKNLSKTSPWLT